MRRRFRVSRICSSDNYGLSKKLHKQYIVNFHEENIVEIERVIQVTRKTHYYVECFGKIIEISKTEALKLQSTMKIIVK